VSSNPYGPVGAQGQAWVKGFYAGEGERKLILALEPAEGSELSRQADEGGGSDPSLDEGEEAA